MTEREKLLAILYDMPEVQTLNETADYLLKHGVTISTTEFAKRETIVEELDSIGGCDATDEWSKGWDAAIDKAIKIVETVPTVKIKKCAFCEKYQMMKQQTKEFCDKTDTKFTVDYSVTLKGSIYCKRLFIGNMDLVSSRLNYCPICGKSIKEGETSDS